jgi:ribosomal protein S18 acetylase RimI-like enzyme
LGEFVIFDPSAHRLAFLELCEEYFDWMAIELHKNYDIDVSSSLGISLRDYVESNVDEFITSLSSDGVLYLLREKDEIIGMGALRKLKEGSGEIKRMYIRSEYRGKGLGREMLQFLLNKCKEYGFSEIHLETGAFMKTAQGLYRSMGFHERKAYPETEVPPQLQHFWIFMEKRI